MSYRDLQPIPDYSVKVGDTVRYVARKSAFEHERYWNGIIGKISTMTPRGFYLVTFGRRFPAHVYDQRFVIACKDELVREL